MRKNRFVSRNGGALESLPRMKGKLIPLVLGGFLLLGFIVWGVTSMRTQPIAVPILQPDGSLGAEFARQSSLLATMIRPLFDRPGLNLTFFHPNEIGSAKIGSSQTTDPMDVIVFHCPVGTSIAADRVFSRFPTGEDQWFWGQYVGSSGVNGPAGDEGARLQNWVAAGRPLVHADHPDNVFPDKNGGLGNKFGGRAAGFSFVSASYVLTEGRYVASADPPPGLFNKVRCSIVQSCGDEWLDAPEQCDDGNTVSGDGCSGTCQSTTQCNDTVDNDGDGLVDTGDPGCHSDGNAANSASYDPTDNNEFNVAVCGNGGREGTEACDDGNLINGDGCSSTCTVTTQCNDTVDNDGDTFIDANDPGCHVGGTLGGAYDPLDNDETHGALCGNGVVEAGEQCDDGNTSNTDACLNTCVTNVCGDGFVNVGVEQCDDGTTCMGLDVNGNPIGDGRWCTTNADCASQPGTTCANHFDPAQIPVGSSGDGCRNNCTKEDGAVCLLTEDQNPGVPERSSCTFGVPSTGGGGSSSASS